MTMPVRWKVLPGYANYVLVGIGFHEPHFTEDGVRDGEELRLHLMEVDEARKLAVELACACDFLDQRAQAVLPVPPDAPSS